MKTLKYIFATLILSGTLVFSSCVDDLNQYPKIEDTSQSVYAKAENYKMVLAKLYASFVIAGQVQGGGNPDINGSKTGFDYMRVYTNMQQVPTDEMVYTWVEGDNLYNLTYLQWDANDNWVSDMYYHIYYTVAICNEFLRNATEESIARFTESERELIRGYRSEARFLRSMAYLHALDLYGNVPFADETMPVGGFTPVQYTQKQMFTFIESELKAIEDVMTEPAATEYGRASQAAAWAMLARLYLNAEVYSGEARYTDCITYCKKIIGAGFSLEGDYRKLFNADNHLRNNEIIFGLAVDAVHTVSWGATTYLVCGSVSSSNRQQILADYGTSSGWGSFRAKKTLTDKFKEDDSRGDFVTDGQSAAVSTITDESQGYLFKKWTNITDAGDAASNTQSVGVSTDLPMFRLADVLLMYAESVVRGGAGGDAATALGYVNDIRTRAFGNKPGNITSGELTTDFILDERARELYMENIRRTDLIRFNKFTSSDYLWEFKGGKVAGSSVDSKYKLYPIPTTELSANPNIKQNPGF